MKLTASQIVKMLSPDEYLNDEVCLYDSDTCMSTHALVALCLPHPSLYVCM